MKYILTVLCFFSARLQVLTLIAFTLPQKVQL